MSYLFQDPKFWLLISFITFIILMIKPFKSMMIGGLDSKINEIKENIDKSLQSFSEAEIKLKEAEKQTEDLSNKIDEIINNAKSQSEAISKNIIHKTALTIQSKEKNSLLLCASSHGRKHNIFGLWSIELYEKLHDDLINKKIRKVQDWIEKNKITNVEFNFKEYDPFFNINTLDDLEAAKKIIKNEKK